MAITPTSRVRATPDQVSSELGKEVVILQLGQGLYYGLDEVGVEIWRKLQDGCRVSEIVAAITEKFEVDDARCEADVLRILGEMEQAQLVVVESA